ncbi:MAG: Rieske 2Fe-2S domain-containing protein [Cellvibrionales bacterium]|nr:Rieske 2Fe-2S domain-containing protein [Cellvibrionales bacterium]
MLDSLATSDQYSVDRDRYRSPEQFAREMQAIFHENWVYLCHASEIPAPGDFRRVDVGGIPLIVVRQDDGSIKGLFNRCAHRGTTVCEATRGNAERFVCPYHGWAYKRDGRNQAPSLPKRYANWKDRKGKTDLAAAHTVQEYRGFIFGVMNRAPAQPLEDWLAGAKKVLDVWIDSMADGDHTQICLAPDSQFSRFRGNWKLQCENSVDAYHGEFVHGIYFRQLFKELEAAGQLKKDGLFSSLPPSAVNLGNGHSALLHVPLGKSYDSLDMRIPMIPDGKETLDRLISEVPADEVNIWKERASIAPFNMGIFPNLVILGTQTRRIIPQSPTDTISEYQVILHKNPPSSAVNELRLRYQEQFYGPYGLAAVDDLVVFERTTDGLGAPRPAPVLLNRGTGQGTTDENGWESGDITDEIPQRAFQSQVAQLLDQAA